MMMPANETTARMMNACTWSIIHFSTTYDGGDVGGRAVVDGVDGDVVSSVDGADGAVVSSSWAVVSSSWGVVSSSGLLVDSGLSGVVMGAMGMRGAVLLGSVGAMLAVVVLLLLPRLELAVVEEEAKGLGDDAVVASAVVGAAMDF